MNLYPKKTYRNRIFNNICKLSGEDYQLIDNSSTDTKAKLYFFLIGSFVLVVSIAAMYSCIVFVLNLFEGKLWLSIPIAIIWAIIVANLYILLLYTITPALVTGKDRDSKIQNDDGNGKVKSPWYVYLSIGLRMAFMVVLALVISQPLVQNVYSSIIEDEIAQYKQNFRNEYIIAADSSLVYQEVDLFISAENQYLISSTELDRTIREIIKNKITSDSLFLYYAYQNRFQFSKIKDKSNLQKLILQQDLTSLVQQEIKDDSIFLAVTIPNLLNTNLSLQSNNYVTNIAKILKQKFEMYTKLDALLERSNFYVRQIQLINSRYIGAYIIMVLVVFAFILPILLKFRIRNTSNFYEVKQRIEKLIVSDNYKSFKEHYTALLSNVFAASKYQEYFRDKINEKVGLFEFYLDPPFNTIRPEKAKQAFDSKSDLLKRIYINKEDEDSNRTHLETITSG